MRTTFSKNTLLVYRFACWVERSASPQLMFDSKAGGSGAVGNAELAPDRFHMVTGGMIANNQLPGNLGVAEALGDQAQHFDLAGSQVMRVGWLDGRGWWGGIWLRYGS